MSRPCCLTSGPAVAITGSGPAVGLSQEREAVSWVHSITKLPALESPPQEALRQPAFSHSFVGLVGDPLGAGMDVRTPRIKVSPRYVLDQDLPNSRVQNVSTHI